MPEPRLDERVEECLRHLRRAIEHKGDERHALLEFRKFYKGYLKAAPGAAQLRSDLMAAGRMEEVEERLAAFVAALESAAVEPALA